MDDFPYSEDVGTDRWQRLRPARATLDEEIARLSGGTDGIRLLARAAQVNDRFKEAVERAYGAKAPLVLKHVNSVYILDKNGVRTLIVYVEESIYAADLNAHRELVRLFMRQLFNEDIQAFEIYVSRGKYKTRHPYVEDAGENPAAAPVPTPDVPLSSAQVSYVADVTDKVEDERLRESLKKAMEANLKRNNSE